MKKILIVSSILGFLAACGGQAPSSDTPESRDNAGQGLIRFFKDVDSGAL